LTNPDGSPVRWNPCDPIHYVLNLSEAPASAPDDVAGAIQRLSTATGMTFVNDGATTEVAANNRPSVQPARYGHRWAPFLIDWSHSGESNLLPGGNVVGEGAATSYGPVGGDAVYVTGQVVIDAASTRRLTPGFGAGTTIGELLLHELGHAMGLGHTADAHQIMYATLLPLAGADYGPGDLTGLTRVGRPAGCLRTPPV
jgi:hypothetical protein